jgi:putative transposase
MARPPRNTVEGMAYHVLNRRVMRLELFGTPQDYEAFERILAASEARSDAPQVLGWCLMPNHWHLVVVAGPGSDLSTWMQWLTVTHTHRWHQHYHKVGEGPLYQGRLEATQRPRGRPRKRADAASDAVTAS